MMFAFDNLETLFVVTAFIFQIVLIVHFALRKWRFDIAMRYGPVVYALSIPAAIISTILLRNGALVVLDRWLYLLGLEHFWLYR